jgi:hypothetical protein
VVIGLAWSIPGCCCGGQGQPAPGSPGTISGRLDFTAAIPPEPAVVYAVSFEGNAAYAPGYAMTRVAPPSTTYQLIVPPGFYVVVARLDSDPASSAGHFMNLKCGAAAAGCSSPTDLPEVRVDSQKLVSGIDVGDWGNPYALYELWQVDLFAEPFAVDASGNQSFRTAPSLGSVPSRIVPTSPAPGLATQYDTGIGIRLALPAGWHRIESPVPASAHPLVNEADFANEPVGAPLELDRRGVWLELSWDSFLPCDPPYPLTATGRATVDSSYGLGDFYFRDPDRAQGLQPLIAYTLMGGMRLTHGCMGFIFVGASMAARDSNLATFAAIVKQARYVRSA